MRCKYPKNPRFKDAAKIMFKFLKRMIPKSSNTLAFEAISESLFVNVDYLEKMAKGNPELQKSLRETLRKLANHSVKVSSE